jgi:hypothetical protein
MYERGLLAERRFLGYGTCRQSGCAPLVSWPLPCLALKLTSRANRAQFMDVALKHIDEDREIVEIALPSIHGSQGSEGELAGAKYLSS